MIHRHALEESSEYRALWRKTVWILVLLWIGGAFLVLTFTRSLPSILNPNDYSDQRHELVASEEEEVFRRTSPHSEESDVVDVPQIWRDRTTGVLYGDSAQIRKARSVVGICQSCIFILFIVVATPLTERLLKTARIARGEERSILGHSTWAYAGLLIFACSASLFRDIWDYIVGK